MLFLSKENRQVLSELVYDNITKDSDLFEKMFTDFGAREKGDVMSLNKKFLSIITDIASKTHEPRKTVSFDQQYNNHKRNFMSYTPKHPEAPIFTDMVPKEPLRNIDEIIKETVISRQYDLAPNVNKYSSPSIQQPKNIETIQIKQIDIQPVLQNELTVSLADSAIELVSDISEPIPDQQIQSILKLLYSLDSKLTGIETELSLLKSSITAKNTDTNI